MTLHLSPAALLTHQRAQQKKWRQDHPDRVKAFNLKHNARPDVKERKKVWQNDNKDMLNAIRRQRYAEKKAARLQTTPEAPPEAGAGPTE